MQRLDREAELLRHRPAAPAGVPAKIAAAMALGADGRQAHRNALVGRLAAE